MKSLLLFFSPLVPTKSPQRVERSHSRPWRPPALGTSHRRPTGSSVAQVKPEPEPWWCRPSEPPGGRVGDEGCGEWRKRGKKDGEQWRTATGTGQSFLNRLMIFDIVTQSSNIPL